MGQRTRSQGNSSAKGFSWRAPRVVLTVDVQPLAASASSTAVCLQAGQVPQHSFVVEPAMVLDGWHAATLDCTLAFTCESRAGAPYLASGTVDSEFQAPNFDR